MLQKQLLVKLLKLFEQKTEWNKKNSYESKSVSLLSIKWESFFFDLVNDGNCCSNVKHIP